ncbi:MAG TPA: TIGR00730 family Rossman fold protein [Novosphingobium sp.]|nr:TIGR00730 family Rossman fold protein [Novosphingobium sp.]
MKRLAVYCGSASPADPRYVDLARDVGATLASRGIGVVYGGGRLGLMGALAAGALSAGGEVIGVIPEALAGRHGRGGEVANHDCTELHIVPGMHQRKQAFTDLSDGFLTIPGGVGTMDELWEAVSWAQLGYHAKPVGLLNAFGFFDHLLAFNRHMIEVGFVREAHQGIIIAESELDLLLTRMAAHEPHTPIFGMKAKDL